MQKYLVLLFFLFCCSESFALITEGASNATCTGGYNNIQAYPESFYTSAQAATIMTQINAYACPAGTLKSTLQNANGTQNAICAKSCACPAGSTKESQFTMSSPTDRTSRFRAVCVPMPSSSSSVVSSSSSSAPSCPAGKTKDANGSCSTCTNGQVLNMSTGSCQVQNTCTYPDKYSTYDNQCHSNPDNCALNASYNPLTEEMCASSPVNNAPSCPEGWTILPNNTCAQVASSAASGAASSVAVSSAASQAASSVASVPSSQASSSAAPKPPTSPTDNIDQNQSTANSAVVPAGTPKSTCLLLASDAACTVLENCSLTFGATRCVGVSTNVTCPNSYVVNGQKVCVLPSTSGAGSSSGNASSAGSASSSAGECDPTAKSYDECMGRNKTPTPAETLAITDKFDNETDKALNDFENLNTTAIEEIKNNGVRFKSAIDSISSRINSVIPQPSECVPYTISIEHFPNITINCDLFNTWKLLFGWFLSVCTAIYVYHLSVRPVEK